jgi:hypothetical protein
MDHSGAALTKYGHTSAYRYIREMMANGGRKIYVIEPAVSAEQTDSSQAGNGTAKVFTIAGMLAFHPVPGTLEVAVSAVNKEENIDYIVDYSSKKVHFRTAPANLAPIVFKWKEYTVVGLQAAFAKLETVQAVLAGLAYGFHPTLVAELKTFTNNCYTRYRPKLAFYTGAYKDATTILTTAVTNASDFMVAWANRSGYFNDKMTDPSLTWLQFIDPASCMLGVAARVNEWDSLHEETVSNLNHDGEWTSSEITALSAVFVNFFTVNVPGNGFIAKNGWTTGASGEYRWIDKIRTWIFFAFQINNDLYVRNLIGNVPVNEPALLTVEQTILNTLKSASRLGVIADPDQMFDTHGVNPVESELLVAIKTPPSQRTPAQEELIQNTQELRDVELNVSFDYQGSIHTLTINLGAL